MCLGGAGGGGGGGKEMGEIFKKDLPSQHMTEHNKIKKISKMFACVPMYVM